MKTLILISLLTSTLFAEHKDVISNFHFTQDVKELINESSFGTKSTYSLLFAKHELSTQDQDLHFYYGAKMGIIREEHAADNGFGIPLNEIGAYYAAAVGMEYDLNTQAILMAEGTLAEDHVHQLSESKVKLTYTYTY